MPERIPTQFTSVFRTSETQNQKFKRNRPTISCTACQKRKLRCDRRQPCGACEKRGHQAACSLILPGNNDETYSNGCTKQDVVSRLSTLEEMMRELANRPGHNGIEKLPARKNSHRSDEGNVPDDTTIYHGSTSWAALVDSIHDIQSVLASEVHPLPSSQEQDVVFGNLAPISMGDIASCLPPRTKADKLIYAFFGSRLVAMPFLHIHHFRRQYEAFWESPSSTSNLWISILFSVLSIGAVISLNGSPTMVSTSRFLSDSQIYTDTAARCLVSGRYAQAKIYSVEAILAHICSRSILKQDSHSDSILWSLHGIAVRVAQKRGYHRNPHIAKFQTTPFETEIRRRSWSFLRSYDLALASQQGLPPIIHEEDCDVEIPKHLTDDDFDEGCVELPAGRSVTDPTPMLFHIQKAGLFPTLDRITRRALGVKPSTAELVRELSTALNDWHESIPPCLAYQSVSTLLNDANYTAVHRMLLELTYLSAKGFLHCPFLVSTKGLCREPAKSMDICRDAAFRIIDIQTQLDQATSLGGGLYQDRHIISNLTLNDFLNATMFIGVDLTQTKDIRYVKAREIAQRRLVTDYSKFG